MEYNIKNVAVYLRKSRAESEQHLEKHRIVLQELCTKHNLKYVEYLEVGTSDSIDMRPKMSRLLKEVEQGIFDAVCVVDYDRLGRGDLGEQDKIKKAFQKSNTLIVTPEKIYNLNNDLDDTYADFKGLFARQEYKMITKRLRQGKQVGARNGEWTNGTPPFPYEYERYKDKYKQKGLVVNDEKLVVYRKIIDMALQGMSTAQISIQLNKEKILSPKNGTWSNVTINRMLIDETHLGEIISNKTQGDGHKKKKPNAKPNVRLPKSEWVVVENCHEAVKTPQEHEVILKFLNERRLIPVHARKGSYSLSGLVFCKVCGHGLTFLTNQRGKFLKPCWYKDHLGNKCKNGGIKYEMLEKLIIDDKLKNTKVRKSLNMMRTLFL
ncbi:recombinase family protein [Brassicibacter mesophilus]|uniref:recombinase family protein n=1 Tax=Brassicibacter mesophilus TaxID=745119 RepID=UPI003D229C90